MKFALRIAGSILMIIGLIWTLQGANILPGSFMTGDRFWLITGVICLVAGLVLTYFAYRKTEPRPPDA